jgi:hypothetical protein
VEKHNSPPVMRHNRNDHDYGHTLQILLYMQTYLLLKLPLKPMFIYGFSKTVILRRTLDNSPFGKFVWKLVFDLKFKTSCIPIEKSAANFDKVVDSLSVSAAAIAIEYTLSYINGTQRMQTFLLVLSYTHIALAHGFEPVRAEITELCLIRLLCAFVCIYMCMDVS